MKNLKFLILTFFLTINFCHSMEDNFNSDENTFKNNLLENLRSTGKIYLASFFDDMFQHSNDDSMIPEDAKFFCQKFNFACNRIAVHWYCVNGCISDILGQHNNLTLMLTPRNKYLLSIAPLIMYEPEEEFSHNQLFEELKLSPEEVNIITTILFAFKYFQFLCCFNNDETFSIQDFKSKIDEITKEFDVQINKQLITMIAILAIAEYMAIYFEPDYNSEMPSLESPLFGNFESIPTKINFDEDEKSKLLNSYGTNLYMQGGFFYWFRYMLNYKNKKVRPQTIEGLSKALEKISLEQKGDKI
ncbi:MAG: hypothetical protein WC436_04000 [Candidatus Babeliales bacterium]